MKKMHLILLALGSVSVSALQSHEENSLNQELECSSLSPEEEAFAARLSETKQKLFLLMSREQRKAAIVAAIDPAISADTAVQQVMQDHHLSFLEDEAAEDSSR